MKILTIIQAIENLLLKLELLFKELLSSESKDKALNIIEYSPSIAVKTSYKPLEQTIQNLAKQHNMYGGTETLPFLVDQLHQNNILPLETAHNINKLNNLKNLADIEGDSAITKKAASNYINAVEILSNELQN